MMSARMGVTQKSTNAPRSAKLLSQRLLNLLFQPDFITGVEAILLRQDLTTRVEGRFKGDHARVARALDAAVEQLAGALEEVSETATGVAASASQIEAGSRTLAHGASDQAGSLEQVSASARELAAMTRQNAASAAE